MRLSVKLGFWQVIWMLLSVLWLMRISWLAVQNYPRLESAATTTVDDVMPGNFVMYGVPLAATSAELLAIHERILNELVDEKANGEETVSLRRVNQTTGVDISVYASSHPWLKDQLAKVKERASRRARIVYFSTWLAAFMIPLLTLYGFGWGVGLLRRRKGHP